MQETCPLAIVVARLIRTRKRSSMSLSIPLGKRRSPRFHVVDLENRSSCETNQRMFPGNIDRHPRDSDSPNHRGIAYNRSPIRTMHGGNVMLHRPKSSRDVDVHYLVVIFSFD